MKSERNRLKTFWNWPPWANQKPEILAKDGFYYTGEIDRVKCAFCMGVLKRWQPSDDPRLQHRIHFPWCPFVCSGEGNMPLDPVDSYSVGSCLQREDTLDMTEEENRLASFSRWPRHLQQTPELLARAGFYYYGDDHRQDRVRCAYCKGRLYDWQFDDDPWVEHARCFPRCHYVRLCMGQDFIDDVQNNRRVKTQESLNVPKISQPKMLPRLPPQQESERNDLDECMQSVQVQAVLQMGFSKDLIRQIVADKLNREGQVFSNAEELASLVIAKENARKVSSTNCSEAQKFEHECAANTSSAMLVEQNERLSEQYLCKICMEERIRMTFMPCGHLVCCENCASVMEECPICRSRISETVRTFY
ncbi:baculoviral IAP repeat-containing protein 7-A-like [Gigantopelta aegis]|uniref:baculoviral IAP repeat-containing protein 7-A-like n=1 Tax=Gigantopelta aegis TaxID=1735272 RepID=UPI001B88ABF4|nr:baculoviral IAP repeat-containing protein 7-A-like [Gigantopelta aegis]XP_041370864.1 baculoviral IAP repeat-containing protein 7-A-like [Gigantopelta aegis]